MATKKISPEMFDELPRDERIRLLRYTVGMWCYGEPLEDVASLIKLDLFGSNLYTIQYSSKSFDVDGVLMMTVATEGRFVFFEKIRQMEYVLEKCELQELIPSRTPNRSFFQLRRSLILKNLLDPNDDSWRYLVESINYLDDMIRQLGQDPYVGERKALKEFANYITFDSPQFRDYFKQNRIEPIDIMKGIDSCLAILCSNSVVWRAAECFPRAFAL
ncbi:MAG: hypothetical protein KJ042_10530 [Deltaproteobacteria bacterium]|nr:hypothetical protein [Deltaproteobacteria bacterium]